MYEKPEDQTLRHQLADIFGGQDPVLGDYRILNRETSFRNFMKTIKKYSKIAKTLSIKKITI